MPNTNMQEVKKEKGNYCFPSPIAKAMLKVNQRVQYEASLLSMSFILLSMLVAAIYAIFFTDLSLFVKIMTGVNAVAAFFFLSSFIITTFQQYQSYLAVQGIIEDPNQEEFQIQLNKLKGGKEDA